MSKLKELIKSHHIQLALATGFSIIILAYFSKRVLLEPIGYLPLAVPPFIALIIEALVDKYKERKILITRYGIAAILLSTVLVILLNM